MFPPHVNLFPPLPVHGRSVGMSRHGSRCASAEHPARLQTRCSLPLCFPPPFSFHYLFLAAAPTWPNVGGMHGTVGPFALSEHGRQASTIVRDAANCCCCCCCCADDSSEEGQNSKGCKCSAKRCRAHCKIKKKC